MRKKCLGRVVSFIHFYKNAIRVKKKNIYTRSKRKINIRIFLARQDLNPRHVKMMVKCLVIVASKTNYIGLNIYGLKKIIKRMRHMLSHLI